MMTTAGKKDSVIDNVCEEDSYFYREIDVARMEQAEEGIEEIVTIAQKSIGDESCIVWDAALSFAFYCIDAFSASFWKDKKILELGAGTGVVGILLAKIGATCFVTDLPEVMPLIYKNISLNFQKAEGYQRQVVRNNSCQHVGYGGFNDKIVDNGKFKNIINGNNSINTSDVDDEVNLDIDIKKGKKNNQKNGTENSCNDILAFPLDWSRFSTDVEKSDFDLSEIDILVLVDCLYYQDVLKMLNTSIRQVISLSTKPFFELWISYEVRTDNDKLQIIEDFFHLLSDVLVFETIPLERQSPRYSAEDIVIKIGRLKDK
eukprot:Awhi_evm1s3596